MIDLESRHLPRLISWTAYVVLCIYIGIPSHPICVQNHILRAVYNQNIVVMLLLDLPAAFDSGDHNVTIT